MDVIVALVLKELENNGVAEECVGGLS